MKRWIAFSLYGSDPLYALGMVENIRLAPEVYPGWSVIVYAGPRAADHLSARVKDGYELVRCPESIGHTGMFWRFQAAWRPDTEYVIFRDADSRLNVREKAAVDEWVASGRSAHVMRDHPHHAHWPMLGGMWGLKGGAIPLLPKLMSTWEQGPQKLWDMRFLAMVVWPLIRDDMMHHSSVPTAHPGARPFPAHPPYSGYVGEIIAPTSASPAVRASGQA